MAEEGPWKFSPPLKQRELANIVKTYFFMTVEIRKGLSAIQTEFTKEIE